MSRKEPGKVKSVLGAIRSESTRTKIDVEEVLGFLELEVGQMLRIAFVNGKGLAVGRDGLGHGVGTGGAGLALFHRCCAGILRFACVRVRTGGSCFLDLCILCTNCSGGRRCGP